jgi:hypothetical protein
MGEASMIRIPLHPRTKIPIGSGWTQPDHTPRAVAEGENTGLRLDGLLDVDLDHPFARRIAEHYMPDGACRWGRRSGLTHYLFECADAEHYVFRYKNKPIVELRTGLGDQTCIPPSVVHVKDEKGKETSELEQLQYVSSDITPLAYKPMWERARSMATVTVFALESSDQGQRHFFALYASGFLVKKGLTEWEVKQIISDWALLTNDEELKDRMTAAKDSIKAGENAAGWKELKTYLSADGQKALNQWYGTKRQRGQSSQDFPDDPRIEETNKTFTALSIGNKNVVAEFEPGTKRIQTLWPHEEFRKKLIKEAPGYVGERRLEYADFWLRHPKGSHFNRLVYAIPGSPERATPNDYNGWLGFTVTPAAGSWAKNKQHILEVICNGRQEIFAWILNWMAALFQQPGQRAGTAILLQSIPGTGKGLFADGMVGCCFDEQQYLHIIGASNLTTPFNEHFSGKCYVFGDEITWGGDKQAAELLKGWITEGTLLINRKFIPAVQEHNMLHIVMSSNSDWPMAVGRKDRRFLVLEVSEHRKGDFQYFNEIIEEMENGGRAAMLHELLEWKVDWNAVRNPIETEEKHLLQSRNLSGEERWLLDWLMNNDGLWRQTEEKHHLYSRYSDSFRGSRHQPVPQNIFGQTFKKYGIEWIETRMPASTSAFEEPSNRRVSAYKFRPLCECREEFTKKLGMRVEWPIEEECQG